jgi:pimeloyl-ACP methyl ester carboxylesterase
MTFLPGRGWRRILGVALTLQLLVINVAVAVNARYGYYGTLADAFGVAADLSPISALDRDGVPAEGVVVTLPIPGTTSGFAARDAYVYVPPAWFERLMTAPPGRQWAVAGFSLGGMCGLMLALRHPDLFQTFGDYGGLLGPRSGDDNTVSTTGDDLFGGSATAFQDHEPSTLLGRRSYAGMGGWFQVGGDDAGPSEAARQLAPLARRAGIATCQVVMSGLGHVGAVWRAAFQDSLPWMSARLGLTRESPSDTAKCAPS